VDATIAEGQGAYLASDDSLAEGTGERVDDGQEHGHAEKEPEPLDGGDDRHSAHVTRDNHKDCGGARVLRGEPGTSRKD
jgi:hypothetical protein